MSSSNKIRISAPPNKSGVNGAGNSSSGTGKPPLSSAIKITAPEFIPSSQQTVTSSTTIPTTTPSISKILNAPEFKPSSITAFKPDAPEFTPTTIPSNIHAPEFKPSLPVPLHQQEQILIQSEQAFDHDVVAQKPYYNPAEVEDLGPERRVQQIDAGMNGMAIHARQSNVPAAGSTTNMPPEVSIAPDGTVTMDQAYFEMLSAAAAAGAQKQLYIPPTQPLQYHLYAPPLPHTDHLQPNQKTVHHFFIADSLREELTKKNEATLKAFDPNSPEAHLFPAELHNYSSLYPLELSSQDKSAKIFGLPTSVYKVTSSVDGKAYVLRRVEGFRLTNEMAMSAIEGWRRIKHPNIIGLKEAFTTKAFGDHSLVFVYDYHPLSETLYSRYLSPQAQHAQAQAQQQQQRYHHQHYQQNAFLAAQGFQPPPPPQAAVAQPMVPENVLWTYLIQIANALKVIHANGLAARIIDPTKILITSHNRIRLNCCGIIDTLTFDPATATNTVAGKPLLIHQQQDDLLHFGQLLISLACGSLTSIHNLNKSFEYMTRHYTPEIKNVVLYLLSKPTTFKSIDDVINMIAPKILHDLTLSYSYNDYIESELAREIENARIVRLLCKLGFINERPEFEMDPSWSETGDRYLLKLFRDYLFHQVDATHRPIIDLGHVLTCLNKLDAGVEEKILLMSRDEQSCLVVGYKELKHCLENTFRELLKKK